MEKLTFMNLSEKVLRKESRPLTPADIWEIAQKNEYDKDVSTKGRTPWLTIGAQLYVDIRDNEKSPFVKIDSKPRKFFLKELVTEKELKEIIKKEISTIEEPKKTKYHESDLHSFLTYFVYTYFKGVLTKTIRHEISNKKTYTHKKTYTQWLHPDLVGVYFPFEEWGKEVIEFSKEIGSQVIKLYSFEMKRDLTFGNLRESFFQAVSNSSWANEGYLVARIIPKDEEFLSELERLSNSFNIGIIEINMEDPDSSVILFPAKYKSELDWDTINKLSRENPGFKEFLKRVKVDHSQKDIIEKKYYYDQVYTSEELKEKAKELT